MMFTGQYINMDASLTDVYSYRYFCIVRPNWVFYAAWRVFLKLRSSCDTN